MPEISDKKSRDEIWEEVKELLKNKYSVIDRVIRLWFDPSSLTFLSTEEAVITTESDFKKEILGKTYKDKISACFAELLGYELKTITVISNEKSKNDEKTIKGGDKSVSDSKLYTEVAGVKAVNRAASPAVYSKYRFENFVRGKSNENAYSYAYSVGTNPSKTCNPLIIHGNSGLGKTHLLHAITYELLKIHPELEVVFVSAEEFTNQLINSLSVAKTQEFRDRYRTVDVLIIDDIQFIAGKKSTQEEFFHTFDELYNNGKQIVLASDKPPKDIDGLEKRLKTRFEQGASVEIQKPEYELRCAILDRKATEQDTDIPNDVRDYIAKNLKDNVRELEGAITTLVCSNKLNGEEITINMAIKNLSPFIKQSETITTTKEKIISFVTENYSVTLNSLKSNSRLSSVTVPRHIACYLLKTLAGMSYPAIGKEFNRDHTTVMNSVEYVKTRMDTDVDFSNEINNIMTRLTN